MGDPVNKRACLAIIVDEICHLLRGRFTALVATQTVIEKEKSRDLQGLQVIAFGVEQHPAGCLVADVLINWQVDIGKDLELIGLARTMGEVQGG